ncbi:hypothetical protein [Flagellimonas crocea]|uniref:hypothetical protein n=1 Tax=Flagellimonas crocea TaxID=3067311 RepID=UPI00296F8B51|nr:hypothetical protein [Muricauda sp. DH64]
MSLVLVTYNSCSDDDIILNCYQGENRSVVRNVQSISGTLREPSTGSCEQGYTIEPDEILEGQATNLLSPCNLEEDFRIDGARVTFSGAMYETFETEDLCANPFELTGISLID